MKSRVVGLVLTVAMLPVASLAVQHPVSSKKLTTVTIPPGDSVGPPPHSWSDLAARADAVVKISFSGYSTLGIPLNLPTRTAQLTFTRYDGAVSEVFKNSPAHPIRGELSVFRRGGIFDTPHGRIKEVEHGFPDWIMGEDYVLFVRWLGGSINGYGIAYGANGTFHLRQGGVVDSPGKAPFSHAQGGKSVQALVAEIRAATTPAARPSPPTPGAQPPSSLR